jgi:hypothetical protein
LEKLIYKIIIAGLIIVNASLLDDMSKLKTRLTRTNIEFDRLVEICINIKTKGGASGQ